MIRFDRVSWQAGTFRLSDICLTVPSGIYGVLMGRTGCGKTSLLEILCGLREASAGRLWIGDRNVTSLAPGLRGIGYVPQDGALFPTMRVAEQIGFSLRLRRQSEQEISRRVHELAEQLGVTQLLDRLPQNLSGGERQRVALGRALAARPEVLLLDEPLSALDEERREEVARLLKAIQRQNAVTVLHITHSRQEASQLADKLFRMEDGHVSAVSD